MPKKPALTDGEIVQGRISITGGDGFNPYSEQVRLAERWFSPFARREQRERVRGVLDSRFDSFCKERIRSQLASLIRQLRLIPTGGAAQQRILADIEAEMKRNPSPKRQQFLGRRKYYLHTERAPGISSCRRELTELFGHDFPEDDLRAAMDLVRKEEREHPPAEDPRDVELDPNHVKAVSDFLDTCRDRQRYRH